MPMLEMDVELLLSKCPKLEFLNMEGCFPIAVPRAKVMFPSAVLNLKHLRVGKNEFCDSSISFHGFLKAVLNCRAMEELDLSALDLSGIDSTFFETLRFSALKKLSLRGCVLSCVSLVMEAVKYMPFVEQVDFYKVRPSVSLEEIVPVVEYNSSLCSVVLEESSDALDLSVRCRSVINYQP